MNITTDIFTHNCQCRVTYTFAGGQFWEDYTREGLERAIEKLQTDIEDLSSAVASLQEIERWPREKKARWGVKE